jgi:hypothetical protein
MRLRMLVVVTIAGGLLLMPTPASAKGPNAVELTGPSLDEPIRIEPWTETGDGAGHVSALVQAARLFSAFGSRAAEILAPEAPPGERGPRYVATYSMVGSNSTSIQQHLYPFADGGPLAYTPPDQSMFGASALGSGWQRVDTSLDSLLVSFGVPAPPGADLEWLTDRDHETGLTISYPPAWQPANGTVAPLLVDPVIPLALGTYEFPTEGCGMGPGPALKALGPKDAFIAVYVFRGAATWAPMLPERPSQFGPDLPWSIGPGKCLDQDDVQGTIRTLMFQDGALQLKALVAMGSDASARRQEQTYRILDTLTVDPTWSS